MKSVLCALCALCGLNLAAEIHTARLNDIPGTAHVVTNVTFPASLATNDVCAIVTNTVEGGWSWEMMPPFVSATEPVFHKWHLPDGGFGGASWEAVAIMEDGYRMPIRMDVPESGEFATKLVFESIGTATRIPGGNALGLAMAKDVMTAEAVTNIVRNAIGTVWDGALGVAWEARMHNGHLYYIAVTNQPPEAK